MAKHLHRPLSYYGTPVKTLGEGTYGKVELFQRPDGETFAVKFEKTGVSSSFIQESSLLLALSHPNVVHALDAGVDNGGKPYLVLRTADFSGEELNNKSGISFEETKSIMYQLALGVAYLTSQGIIHRDIKPGNTLITRLPNKCLNARIADLGLVETLFCDRHSGDRVTGYTKPYRPIELFLGDQKYDFQADVWALGTTFYEMMTGKMLMRPNSPFGDEQYIERIIQVIGPIDVAAWPEVVNLNGWSQSYAGATRAPNFKPVLPTSSFYDLLTRMMRFNPAKRATIFEVLAHPFFDTVRGTTCVPKHIPKPIPCSQLLQEITLPIKKPSSIEPRVRNILFDWMYEIAIKVKVNASTIFLSYVLADYFFSETTVERSKWQLYGAAALGVGSRFFNQDIQEKDLVYMTYNTYTVKQITEAMIDILAVVKFDCYRATPTHYLSSSSTHQSDLSVKHPTILYLYAIYRQLPKLSYEKMAQIAMSLTNGRLSRDDARIVETVGIYFGTTSVDLMKPVIAEMRRQVVTTLHTRQEGVEPVPIALPQSDRQASPARSASPRRQSSPRRQPSPKRETSPPTLKKN